MMRIVEKSSDHLRLSDASTFWSKWGFVTAIVAVLLSVVFISARVIRPACLFGVVLGGFMLFLLVRELPRSFDIEFWFDRAGDQLKVIKRPWLGRRQSENYPLPDITQVRVVAQPGPRHYPGHDYDDAETQPPIAKVELSMRSGSTLTVAWGHGEYEATQFAASIAEFLGLTITTA
jgi:hypothetical protein